MIKTREFKNIGTVDTSEITLSDTVMSLFIPIETESEFIREERENLNLGLSEMLRKKIPMSILMTAL